MSDSSPDHILLTTTADDKQNRFTTSLRQPGGHATIEAMAACLRKFLTLAVGGISLFAAPALSNNGTAIWSTKYGNGDTVEARDIAVDPMTGHSYIGILYSGALPPAERPVRFWL